MNVDIFVMQRKYEDKNIWQNRHQVDSGQTSICPAESPLLVYALPALWKFELIIWNSMTFNSLDLWLMLCHEIVF